jgi:hypothetical protein
MNKSLVIAACVMSFIAFGPGGIFVSLFLLNQWGDQ